MSGKHTVLILDVDGRARGQLRRCLEGIGFAVEEAGSWKEGGRLLREHAPGCVVIDTKLGDCPGVEAIERVREVRPQAAIIATSGESSLEVETRVREKEVFYYHVKGFAIEELVKAVASAVGGGAMEGKGNILVVDDDPDYQAAVKQILQSSGYEVTQATTKEEGLEALKSAHVDLVILDIMMATSTDGFHFLYEMKAGGGGEKPPVLSVSCISDMTGFDFSPTGEDDYFPVEDYLVKPVAPAELLSHVEALLSGRKQPKKG